MDQATNAYRGESDLIGQFISDVCRVDPGASEDTGTLYKNYQGWAITNGLNPWTANAFGRELSRRGFDLNDSKHKRTGIEVITATFKDAATEA